MELSEKKLKKMYEKNLKILNELAKQKSNKTCADCSAANTKWASSNLGVFLCIKCAGFHRKLGSSIVKSITLDNWTKEEMEIMIDGGNEIVNSIYLNGSNKPLEADFDYIKDKYERKMFAKQAQSFDKHQKSGKETLSILENMGFTKNSINLKALELAGGDVQTAIELLLSGAVGDVASPKKHDTADDKSHELSLPKLPNKKDISQTDSMGDSSASLQPRDFKIPDLRMGENSDIKQESSLGDKGNRFDTIKDEKIKQALENAIEQLASFGFSDASDSRAALRQARGDVEKALGILLKWKDERAKREDVYKSQRQTEESKADKQNFLGSMDNMAPSQVMGNGFKTQSHQVQNQPNQFQNQPRQVQNQPHQFPTESIYKSPLQYEVSGYISRDSFQYAQTQPISVQTSFQEPPSTNNIIQPSQSTQPSMLYQAIQNPQTIQNAPPPTIYQPQNTIDIFSDQFGYPSSLNSQPILPTNGWPESSKKNPFASKPLLPAATAQNTSYNFVEISNSDIPKDSNNLKQKLGFSNDLADISFGLDSAPALPVNKAPTFNGQIFPVNDKQNMPAQNVAGQSKPSKDIIMSLYNNNAANNTHIQNNPFAFNQQQSMPLKPQHRLSLVKTINPNPFVLMNGLPNATDGSNYSSHAGISKNVSYQIPNGSTQTNPSGRNYQLDNYSASALGISEIFAAPPALPSDKERANASLFSDLPNFKR